MRKLLLVGIVLVSLVVGGVVGLTWFTDGGPEPATTGENGGLDGTGYQTEDLPRGVTIDTVAVSPLLEEHVNRLSDSTYVLTVETTKQRDNQSVQTETVYTVGQRELLIEQYGGDDLLLVEYYDGQTGVVYQCTDPQQSPCPTSVTRDAAQPEIVSDLLRSSFVNAKWVPVTVDEDTTYTEVTLSSTELVNEDAFAQTIAIDSVSQFNATAIVDSRQVISKLHVTAQSGAQEDSYKMTISGLNQTVVEQPEWVEAEPPQVRQQSGITIDNRTVFYTHATDAPIPSGATVTLYSTDDGQFNLVAESQLSSELTRGETAYITIVDGVMNIEENDSPAQRGDVLPAQSYVLRITDPNAGEVRVQIEITR